MALQNVKVTSAASQRSSQAPLGGSNTATAPSTSLSQATSAYASLTDLTSPAVRWADLAVGFGVPSVRVDKVETLITEFKQALQRSGPSLIEAVL